MKVNDFKTIVSAKPLYPDMMSSEAEKELIKLFKDIINKKDTLAELQKKVILLEQELSSITSKYNDLIKLFNIEYKTIDVKEIKNDCNLGVFNKDDARNR